MPIVVLVLISIFGVIGCAFIIGGVINNDLKARWLLVCLVPILSTYWLAIANKDCKSELLGIYPIQEVGDKDGTIQVIVVDGEVINVTKWFGRSVKWKAVKVDKEEAETHGISHDVRNMKLSNGDVEKEK